MDAAKTVRALQVIITAPRDPLAHVEDWNAGGGGGAGVVGVPVQLLAALIRVVALSIA